MFETKQHKINYLKKKNREISREIDLLVRKYKSNEVEIKRLQNITT